MSSTDRERTRVMEALFRAHRLLCSRFVSEERFRAAFGAPRADMNATAQYLSLPPAQRPVLSLFFDAAYYRAQLGDGLAESDDPLLHFLEHGLVALRSPHPRWSFARASCAVSKLDDRCPPLAAATGTKGKSTIAHDCP